MFRIRRLVAIAVCLLVLASPAFATLGVRTVWEFNASATANNINGGGFDAFTSVANMIADLACTSGTTSAPDCTSATYNFGAGDVNHWLFISSGTGFTSNQFCQITSIASTTHAVLNAAVGACNVISASIPNTGWTTNAVAGLGAASPSVGVFSIDRSRSTALVQQTTTATNTAGVITAGSLTYDKTWIGNVVQIVGGAGATVGWYAITNDVVGTSFTLDRDPGGTVNVSINLGGAFKFGSTTTSRTDDDVLELGTGTNGTGAMRFFFKLGSYSTTNAIAVTVGTGATQTHVILSGYGTVRGDNPTSTSRPTITTTGTTFTLGANYDMENFIVSTTAAAGIGAGTSTAMRNMKVTNISTTTTRVGITGGANFSLFNSEVVSYRGVAVAMGSQISSVVGNYIHDSDTLISSAATTNPQWVVNNVFMVPCGANAIGFRVTTAMTGRSFLYGNTFIGGGTTTKMGTAINYATGTLSPIVRNNIFAYWVTPIIHADVQTTAIDDFNDYYLNTNANTNWISGLNDITTNPSFGSLGQTVVSTATTTNVTPTNALTKAGATFITDGVTAGRDYVCISASGSGTTGVYGISSVDSETQITLDLAPGASAGDVTAQIVTGRNLLPTVALSGFPGAFQGGYTTGYVGMGAAQRNSSSTGGGGGIIGQ